MKRLLPSPYAVKFFVACALLITVLQSGFGQTITRYGNSYVNISKKTSGGTVEPGDTLEIRSNYYIPFNLNSGNGSKLYNVRFVDNIPSNTTFISSTGEYLITNEGLNIATYTAAASDDQGTYRAAPLPSEYNIRINLGTGGAAPTSNNPLNLTGAGTVSTTSTSTDAPKVGGGLLISTAFRVQVTGGYGGTIQLGAGKLYYRTTSSAVVDQIVNLTQYQILIATNDPICPDYIGKNFIGESGGTFDSGTVQNRAANGVYTPAGYSRVTLPSGVNDGYYAIVNNLSPTGSTNVTADRKPTCPGSPAPQNCSNRMFSGYWDIMGDHTGSTTSAGNAPTPVGSKGGYMLVVNSDYVTTEAYRQDISGLCPNTTYEFSLWVKNVCPVCGIDKNGVATYQPGVYPNLTFVIDGVDRYSSGEVGITGWMKKGFLFKTASGQTGITVSIRNNASGGGGNDWAIDDIALVTCNPKLNMVPTGNSNVCLGNTVDISTKVSAFFSNYTEFKWEKSIDNGSTWNVISSGSGSPTQPSPGAQYEYTAALPTFVAGPADHLNQYRFTVASSTTNLADPNCAFQASSKIIVLVSNCNYVLKTGLLYFNGQLQDGYGHLNWKTETEDPNTIYEIERSADGENFVKIGEVLGKAPGTGAQYAFTDSDPVRDKSYYRLRIIEKAGGGYSKIALLTTSAKFDIQLLINPFTSKLSFDLVTPEAGRARVMLVDMYGRIIKQSVEAVQRGANAMNLYDLGMLAKGVYTLSIELGDKKVTRKLVKMDK